MKKTRILLVLLVFALGGLLTACGESKKLEEAVTDLQAQYADTLGAGSYEVTEDLSLVTTVGEVSVAWSSSNTAAITNAGAVTRANDDVNVTLTATLTIKDLEETVTFSVVVVAIPAADQVASAKTALVSQYADTIGNENYDVTSNLSLVTSINGVTVTWSSNNTDVIANDGTVTRPTYTEAEGEEYVNVMLTATLTKGSASDTYTFTAYVLTLDRSVEETLNLVLDGVVVFPENEGVTGEEGWLGVQYDDNNVITSIPFLASYTFEGTEYSITWSSSDTAYVDLVDDGAGHLEAVVTRPDTGADDVVVTLTASITYGEVTVTRTYELTVLAYQPSTLLTSIGDIYDQEVGTYLKVEGVTVIAKVSAGAFIYDGSDVMYIYDTSDIYPDLVVGNVYDIEGVYLLYYGGPELVSDTGLPLTATDSTADAVELSGYETTIADLLADRTTPNNNNPMQFELVKLTVKVVMDPADTNGTGDPTQYNTYLVPTDYTGTTVVTNVGTDGKATEFALDDILLVYYGSPNKDAVTALDGKIITIDVLLYGYRSDRNIWYVYFLGDSEDITVHLTDEQAVAAAQENLANEFPATFYEGTTISLPSLYETTTTYASDNEAVIDPTTGAVTLPAAGSPVTVTLTATISKGTVDPVEVTIVISVGVPAVSTISDAKAETLGTVVVLQGIVTANEYQNTYFIQDATGGIAVYSSNATVEAFLQANYGNEVQLLGYTSAFKGLVQLNPDSDFLTVTNSTDPVFPTATNVDAMALTSEALMDYQGSLVEITGLYVSSVSSDSYGNAYITLTRLSDNSSIDMKWDSRVTLTTEAATLLASITEGSVVNVVNPLAWNNAPYFYFTSSSDITFGTLSDADAVAAVKAFLPDGFPTDDILADTTLDLISESLGVAITWASDDETAVNPTTGAVTIPTDGSQVIVTLTASLSKGTETDEVTITLFVGETPAITIAEASALAVASEAKIQGVITSGQHNGEWFIQDATGGILIYVKYNRSDVTTQTAFFNDNYGNEVKITGTLAAYNGLIEFIPGNLADFVVVNAVDAVMPTATNIDAYELDATGLADYQGLLVELTGLYVSDVYVDSYENVKITLVNTTQDKSVVLDYSSYTTLSEVAATLLASVSVGDVVNVVTNLSWSNGPKLNFSDSTQITFGTASDMDLVYADAKAIEITTSFTEAGTLTLPASGTNGTTITWVSSDNATIDESTGAVTLPATEGTSVVVTMTATVTLNSAEYVVTIDVTVTNPTTTSPQTLAYSTTFESTEGFAATTSYNNVSEVLFGNAGEQWGSIYGTVSTTAPIEGTQSAQMRWYTTAPTALGSFTTKFAVNNAVQVVFSAASTYGLNVEVSYSTDGTTWLGAQTFTLGTTSAQYTYDIVGTGDIYIKFAVVLPATNPTTTSRLFIDEVSIYTSNVA